MFIFRDIHHYQHELTANNTTCVDAVQYYLQQIDTHKKLNAFTEVFAAEALEQAAMLDEKRKAGQPLKKLHGVVIAIKDVLCYKGHTVTASSNMLKGFTSLYTATAVQRLLDEDAIIIGNCNCDEFAMGSSNENSAYGNVLNALDNTMVPGGSSGGSAVAVQAGLCMASLGSDTGGSVRQPADFCGIIGLKPTYGRISRYGLIAYASSFDQVGIFGNNVADIALLLEIMSGEDAYDSTALAVGNWQWTIDNEQSEKKYKIAYFKEALHHPSLDKEIKEKILNLVASLRSKGHTVTEIDFDLLDYVVPAYYVLTTAEASSNLSRYDGIRYGHQTKDNIKDLTEFYKQNRTEGFGKEVQRRIMLGTFVLSSGYYDAYFSKAQQVRRLLIDQTDAIFADYEAVIMPTSPTTAFEIGHKNSDPVAMYLADIFTVFANLTGIPGISVPLFTHSNGMPFGLQIMTKKADELTLLQLADYLVKQQS
ncbi:MAG: Asp-tRNA(Asn)/Glu-tRNA(Gln) amidotransferase subunit GatA [Chitinophagaceae bacterium]|nr:Asp-tRNA(Asn)/Glu-tRNA(Gln) amidotransferase subunit GatA [Chitinophagaceae bacterium]MBK8786006.1 Asp-tRNA(Asn)/Glu-tRNA(Gln) amidotransferase subunit GatA [Chitinophagaceae bacterium]MBK9485314.1 Asp-tRNA(Asn)/Glu-tRNA(Gln) amidotransferase subunit GatA [Chitinophagaceae bacterium]MBL0199883.1 Asp-tRNA(Asn)/Glu-tRNA(Gln) amidotransferase subunit GatA [Chitinophagaceae bacterium]